jgi:hypothetical protein
MRAVKLALLSCFVALIASTPALAQLKPLVMWQPIVEMDEQIFPSYLIAAATMKWAVPNDPAYIGDPDGQLGIAVTSYWNQPLRCRLEIKAPEIMENAVSEHLISKSQLSHEIFPKIKYRFDFLSKIEQPMPLNITFTLYVNGEFFDEKVLTVKVHSINDCPSAILHRKGAIIDRNWMFAAYVNENHPWIVNQFLPEMMRSGLVNAFTGYQVSEFEVYRQVFAIWSNLQQRGFRYSDVAVPTVMSQNVRNQYVRFLGESVNTSQANCVDGSVLFASVLRRISLDPVLVLTPTHCFVGFYLDRGHQRWNFLETTLLGNTEVPEAALDPQLWSMLSGLLGPNALVSQIVSLKAFAYALQVGLKNYNEIQQNLKTYNLDYQLIDISAARLKIGVMPISR